MTMLTGQLAQMERSEVYSIPIKDVQMQENAAYVGVTGRTLASRIEEHEGILKTILKNEYIIGN